MTRRDGHRLLWCTLLLCVNLAFIWGNSILPAAESGRLSAMVTELVRKLLGTGMPNEATGEHLLRKMAHFAEFCWLGLNLTWFFLLLKQKGIHGFSMPLLGGMTAACIDATIQIYVPGRSASVTDVWIDVSGVTLGIMILLAGHYVSIFNQQRKK